MSQDPAVFVLGLSKQELARCCKGRARLVDDLTKRMVRLAKSRVIAPKAGALGSFVTLAASPGAGKTSVLAALLSSARKDEIVALPVAFNHSTSMLRGELPDGTVDQKRRVDMFSNALGVRLLFAATRSAKRWESMMFSDFLKAVTSKLSPAALMFENVCHWRQKVCDCPLLVAIDEVSKEFPTADVVNVLIATELRSSCRMSPLSLPAWIHTQ